MINFVSLGFGRACGVQGDDGNVFISDTVLNQVRRFTGKAAGVGYIGTGLRYEITIINVIFD